MRQNLAPAFELALLEPRCLFAGSGYVNLEVIDSVAAEGADNSATFRITRSGLTSKALTVFYDMTGNAKNGRDYDLLAGSIILPKRAAFVDIVLHARTDFAVEGSETAGILLKPGSDYVLGQAVFGTSRIKNTAVTVVEPPQAPIAGTLKWTNGQSAGTPRAESHSAVVKGRLYNLGGFFDNTYNYSTRVDYYDPATNKWTRVADMPKAIDNAGVAVVNDEIWLAGGYSQSPGNTTGGRKSFGITDVWIYNTTSNTWRAGPTLPSHRASAGMALLNNQLHLVGGEDQFRKHDLSSHLVLDLGNVAGGWKTKASMPLAKNRHALLPLGGKIYAVGGQTSYDANAKHVTSAYVYDPTTDRWSTLANIPLPTSHMANSAIIYRGKIVILGGETTGLATLSSVYSYDPVLNSWKKLTSLPSARHSPTAGVINDKIYVDGGASGPSYSNLWIGTFS